MRNFRGGWIEMDDRTNYKVERDGRALVSMVEEPEPYTREDEDAIGSSLGQRIDGLSAAPWQRVSDWSTAEGDNEVVSHWARVQS